MHNTYITGCLQIAGSKLFLVKLVLPIYYIVLYSCRLTAFHQGRLQTVAVSELPGYLGRQHAQRSRYVTAKFPRKEISTNFTWAMPGSGTTNGYEIVPRPSYVCTYHSFFTAANLILLCAHTIPTYLPTSRDNQLLVWLTAHFQTEKEKWVVRSYYPLLYREWLEYDEPSV